MQATGSTRSGQTGPLHYRYGIAGHKPRIGASETADSPVLFGNDFLTTKIESVAPVCVTLDNITGDHNYIIEENYALLLESALNYSKLLKAELKHNPGNSIGEGISNLYDELQKILPENQHLNIEHTHKGEMFFCIYYYHNWSSNLLLWLEVDFLDKLKGVLKRIAITFLHDFIQSNGIDTLYNAGDAEFIIENLEENILNGCFEKTEVKEIHKMLHSYRHGHIKNLLERIENRSYYKNLQRAIDRYKPQTDWEKGFIKLMKSGLEFIGKDRPSIMHYCYDPDFDSENDWQAIGFDRTIRVIYDWDDYISQSMLDWLNSELQETYDLTACTTLYLKPDSDKLFKKDEYPDKFYKWFKEFSNYTDNNP